MKPLPSPRQERIEARLVRAVYIARSGGGCLKPAEPGFWRGRSNDPRRVPHAEVKILLGRGWFAEWPTRVVELSACPVSRRSSR